MTQIEYSAADVELFWSRVDRNGPVPTHRPELAQCWVWTASKIKSGYGRLTVGGREVYAHRFSETLARGPLPSGIEACHHCDYPPCVRPSHLFRGTHADNMRDATSKGRGGSCRPMASTQRGEAHYATQLTEAIVREIRARAANGSKALHLAREYGIGKMIVYRIVRRETWKHVI